MLVVAPLRADPGRRHPLQVKRLPAQPHHGGYETPQQLLAFALALQVLRLHGVGGGGRVDGLQGAHDGCGPLLFGGLALFRGADGQLFQLGVFFIHKILPKERTEDKLAPPL